MIEVKIKAILDVARLLGSREQTLTLPGGATVLGALQKLAEIHGEPLAERIFAGQDKLRDGLVVMVNGRNICFLDHLHTVLTDGDEVLLFPPAGGG
ncbi:MAG TPA: MoaD/ThiS family protein [Firmicutes bacterium]|nr:MoaD/ThiS family protein [Bacillota bacterium]